MQGVLDALRKMIVGGTYGPEERLPSRRELAGEYEVSPVTVDRALHALEGQGFIETRGTAGRFVTTFPPHLHQFALALPDDPVSPYGKSNFYDALVRCARSLTAEDPARRVRVYTEISGHVDVEDYQRLMRDIAGHRLAGVIFAFPGVTPDGRELVDTSIPRVMISTGARAGVPALYPDMRQWFSQALDRLKARGCRRIAMLQLPHMSGGQDDWLQWLAQGCAERDLQTAPWMTQFVSHRFARRNVGHAVQLLSRLPDGERPDGLLVADDHLVAGAVEGLAEVSGGGIAQVVAHCNWPLVEPRLPANWQRLGFDADEIIDTALELLAESTAATQPINISPRTTENPYHR